MMLAAAARNCAADLMNVASLLTSQKKMKKINVSMSTKIAVSPDDVLSTSEVCALAEITRQTLYAWIEQGKIKPWRATRNGATKLFLRSDAEKLKGIKYKRSHD